MNILLLHGALGSAAQLNPLKEHLQLQGHQCHLLEFSGHGATPYRSPFSISLFSGELQLFLSQNPQIDIVFGYSMGGYVALYLAATANLSIKGIITLATKFAWDRESATREISKLNPAKIEEKIPAFAQTLAKRHTALTWQQNMKYTATMMEQLGDHPAIDQAMMAAVNIPVLFSIGDRDEMVSIAETMDYYKSTPKAACCVLPLTGHPIEKLKFNDATYLIDRVQMLTD